MKQNSLRFQPLALPHTGCYAPDPARITNGLKRLELLMPEIISRSPEDLSRCALAFIERYQDDVLQLEMEWEILYAALVSAWQRKDYATVVRLVAVMARPVCRICSIAYAEHLLHIGIEASRRIHDNQHYVSFLNRLGGLLFSHARYWLGRQIWSASLQLAASSASTFGLWQPLSSFAHIADILGNYGYAKQFVEALLNTRHSDEPDSLAVALFIRGFYARHMRDLDVAREDFRCCLRLLTNKSPDILSSPDRRLFMLVVQTELARVEGNYARSQDCAEAAFALAQVYSDRYTVAALLFDQGLYAHSQGQFADIPAIFVRLHSIAQQMNAPHVYQCCRFLGQYHIGHAQENSFDCHDAAEHLTATMAGYDPLSQREREVLHFVAAGLSNREIATRLVISPVTVKKHLEHIYTRLDVHNRTSAIARARMLKEIL